MSEKNDETGLSVPNASQDVAQAKPKFKLPELEPANLQIALAKLSEAGYPDFENVAKILMPDFEQQVASLRTQIGDAISATITIPRPEGIYEMDSNHIMLGLVHLFLAKHPDLTGVARIWIPDFDKKMELMGAKNIKLIPRIYDSCKAPGWNCMVRICYEMDRAISGGDQHNMTESACCHPTHDFELENFCRDFAELVKLPAATSLITKGGGHKWHVVTNGPFDIEGDKMPAGVTLVAVCEREFWQPLAKKDEKDEK